MNNKKHIDIPLVAALIPITLLIVGIVLFLVTNGADDIQLFSQPLLILCGFAALSIAIIYRRPLRRPLKISIGKSFTQAVPVLAIL